MKRKNKPQLALEHASDFQAKIENEGDMLYVVQNWEFKDFKDKKFNSLRKALVKAAQDLIDYCAFERLEEPEVDADGYCNTCLKVAENCICDMVVEETCERCGDALADNGICYTCNDD